MAKDYARYANAVRKPKKKSGKHFISVLIFVLCLTAAGSIFYILKIKPNRQDNQNFFAALKTALHHKAATPVIEKKPVTAKVEPEIKFDFYNQLPNMQVQVPTTQQSNTASIGYVLQLGMFNTLNDASEARISYLLAGADASIVKMGNSFRVQQGPYTSELTAKKIQKKLLSKGVEAKLIKNQ